MEIESVSIGGFANIPSVKLTLQDITALIAPNGYGKSNLLRAVEFGCRFIVATEQERRNMMESSASALGRYGAMPINRTMLGNDFKMEINGFVADFHFEYGYTFKWADVDSFGSPTEGGAIVNEWLRIKKDQHKYRQALSRLDSEEFTFLSSPSGRCATKDTVTSTQLALQKLAQNKGLFYAQVLSALAGLEIPQIDTLDNPETYFSADGNKGVALFDGLTLSAYLFRLREQKPLTYSVLEDGIKTLVPHLARFEPQEIVLADGRTKLYDILIEESNNAYATSVRQMSSGSKRVVLLFTLCVAASQKGLPLLLIEEPENSVHPRLLENLLLALHDYAGETKILLTSHSPYLMRYLAAGQMYFGLPNGDDVAEFARLKDNKVKTVTKLASALELTVGEYMFDFILDLEQEREKLGAFFQM